MFEAVRPDIRPRHLSAQFGVCKSDAAMTFSPAFNPVFAKQGTTIFTVMSALATEHKAVNLGQGFPDLDGPEAIRAAAAQVLMEGPEPISAHARRAGAAPRAVADACRSISTSSITTGATRCW